MGWFGQDGMRDSLMNAPEATVQDRPAATRQADGPALREPQGTFGSGATLWFTGLPSAGKSTIAHALARRLADDGRRVQVLDGDEVRPHLSAGLGYGREDRDVNVRRIGWVARLLASHGVVVLVPVIAPYADSRLAVRGDHVAAGVPFAEIYVSTALEVAEARDVKGLYAKARRGEITAMTGVDDPYEVPRTAELVTRHRPGRCGRCPSRCLKPCWSRSPTRSCHEHLGATATTTELQALESESIHIIREVAATFASPVMLFSGGKDSVVMLHLAAKAFWPAPIPFGVLHVDTGHNFAEVLEFRDEAVAFYGAQLKIASVEDYLDDGRLRERPDGTRNPLQTVPLLDAISEGKHDAVFGGGRRDEERARAKERVFSMRDEFGQWEPRNQRPELWSLYNGRHLPGEHVRVFPLSNWTELDVWDYIESEKISLPSIYYAHEREVVQRDGMWIAITDVTPARDGEQVELRSVRYRTVGDMSCTAAVLSNASTVHDVITEVALSALTERGATRADDRLTEAAMEDRKREGYF